MRSSNCGLIAVVACLSLGLVVCAGCARGADEFKMGDRQFEVKTSDIQNDDSVNDSQAEQGTADDQDRTIELKGHGRQASKKFRLESGLSLFSIEHDGESNIIVRLLDAEGNTVDTLFNQIGEFDGQRGFAIGEAGQYLLDVTADGNWAIDIRQPRPSEGRKTPQVLDGSGFDVTEFIELDKGLSVFKIHHNGEGRFTVKLVDRDGHQVESLVNVLGKFDGSKPVKIEKPGTYFLNVGADGDWTIEVE